MPYSTRAPSPLRDLAASDRPWFFFDGAAAPDGEPGVSYLGSADDVLVAEPGEELQFFAALRSRQAASRRLVSRHDGVPAQRFRSGWVVALGYEFGLGLLGLNTAPRHGTGRESFPTAVALRVDRVFALPADETDLQSYADPHRTSRGAGNNAVWRSSDAAYEQQVAVCQAAIHRGDAYVLCLTDTAEAVVPGPYSPLDLYARLRASGAAMRGGIIATEGRALVSASPERFLSVVRGRVSTHPIKGTRRRGVTPAEDARLAAELARDPKERAENLMIVDLMRNDLSRVCDAGTVRVSRFLDIESHPSVHQLVSTVEGKLVPGRDAFDVIAACFPGGSMTGAPKHSATRILADLEEGPRGLYSGCFGWIDDSGDAELAMTIRGVELRGAVTPGSVGEVQLLVGAGGGITADSVPTREREERDLKAESLLSAL